MAYWYPVPIVSHSIFGFGHISASCFNICTLFLFKKWSSIIFILAISDWFGELIPVHCNYFSSAANGKKSLCIDAMCQVDYASLKGCIVLLLYVEGWFKIISLYIKGFPLSLDLYQILLWDTFRRFWLREGNKMVPFEENLNPQMKEFVLLKCCKKSFYTDTEDWSWRIWSA